MKVARKTSLGGPADAIHSAAFIPTGALLVATGGLSGHPGQVWAWRCPGWDLVAHASLDQESIATLACSPTAERVAVCGQLTTRVDVLDRPGLTLAVSLPFLSPPWRRSPAGHLLETTHVTQAAFDPEGRRLALACWDGTAKILDIASGTCTELPHPRDDSPEFLQWTGSAGELITGSYQRLFRWDLSSGTLLDRLDLGREEAWKHVGIPGTDRVVSVSLSGRVVSRDLHDANVERHEVPLKPGLARVAYSSSHHLLALARKDGLCVFWDTRQHRLAGKLRIARDGPSALAFHPDDPVLAVTTGQGEKPLVVLELADLDR